METAACPPPMIGAVLTQEQLEHNWAASPNYLVAKGMRRYRSVAIASPFGQRREFTDAYITEPSIVRLSSSKTLWIEVTDRCNVACRTCYNFSNTRPAYGEVNAYMSAEFAQELADFIGANPYPGQVRNIILTGGEPTIDFERLRALSGIFAALEGRNSLLIITNSTGFPTERTRLETLIESFGPSIAWFLSYNTPLADQYLHRRGKTGPLYDIPTSGRPLLEKIRCVSAAMRALGRDCVVGVNNLPGEQLEHDLLSFLEPDRIYCSHIKRVGAARNVNGIAEPSGTTKQRDMLYVRGTGQVFPGLGAFDTTPGFGWLGRILSAK
jgi:hypothetical protein